MKPLAAFIIVFFTVTVSFSQSYDVEIKKAGISYEKKKYDSCAYYFSKAFLIQKPKGNDLYNAAVCNTLNDNIKNAFKLLNIAVEQDINISKLKIDPDLDMLHRFAKWKKLITKAGRIQKDSLNTLPYPEYANRLALLWEQDQYYRFRLGKAYENKDTVAINKLWQQMRTTDSVTLPALEVIINKIGWPTKRKVGKYGAATVFLIIDHSPREVMEKYFPFLEQAAKNGEALLSQYATMKDRILVNRGKKQMYGTQKYWDKSKDQFVFFPIEDEKNVNTLRKEAGLEPLKEFQ